MTGGPIKVHCIDQQNWFIQRDRCGCRGTYDTGRALQMRAPRPYGDADVIVVPCRNCGTTKTYEFDITSFHSAATRVLFAEGKLSPEERQQLVSEALAVRAGGRMESVLEYLAHVGRAGDRLALEYLEDAIRHHRDQVDR